MRRLALVFLCLASTLPLHAAITGTLINSDGQPVAGAKVSIFPLELPDAMRARLLSDKPDRAPIASASSDSKGKFSLESPKDPVVTLNVSAAGYAPLALPVERDEAHGAILLAAAAMKQGRVLASGKGVAGAKVALTGNGEYATTTDAEGRYSVPDPEKWALRILIAHPDFAVVDEYGSGLEARKFASDRSVEGGMTLSGRVVSEDGKTPVAGASIAVDDVTSAKSADDGTFAVAHAPRKWRTVTARSGALAGERERSAEGPVIVRMANGGVVNGSIRDAKTQAPVAGALIHLSTSRRFAVTAPAAATITDAKGTFSLIVPPGSYSVIVTRPGYAFANLSVSAAANTKVTKNVAATQLARVNGNVIDENKGAVAGTRLAAGTIASESGMRMFRSRVLEQSAVSGPDGAFMIRVEPDTDIQIEAKKKGYPEARSATMHFAPGERKTGLLLTIPLGVQVAGRVTDKNGKPVSGVTVTATESRSGGGPFTRRVRFGDRSEDDNVVRTSADGSFSMRVKPGTYDLRFKHEGYASKNVNSRQINASTAPMEVTLEPGVALNGRVTRGGAGVEEVQINILGEDTEAHAETAPDGSFHLADLTPGQVMVMAAKPEEFIQQIRPVTIPSDDLVIDLPAGGTISGRVVEKDSKAPVTTFDAGFSSARGGGGMMFMGPPLTKHFTSDDGTFVLNNVPPGVTTLSVTAPGFTSGRVQNLNVENNKTLHDVTVEMEHGVKVTGRVTGSDGTALSGVAVSAQQPAARRMPGYSFVSPTFTDANGEYSMDNVEGGERTFTFELSGYLTTQKTATLSGTEARVDAQLSTGLKLTGYVVTDAGAPIADANVQAQTAADSTFRSTRTDANGQFEMNGLAAGRYTFRATKSGFASGILKDVDISAGAPVRIVVQPGGTITGRINGLTPDELTRAGVNAQSSGGSYANGTVDPSGTYRIEGAPTGTVRVTAMVASTGGWGGRNSPAKSVQLEPGGTAQVDLEFVSGSIRGRVTRDGQPAAQAMILFMPQRGAGSTNARVTTDSNGNYEAQGLEDATYDVQVVDMQRGAPYSTTYTVNGSGTFNIDIKSVTLRGRVVDAETGRPIEDAIIQMRASGDSNTRMQLRVMPIASDASGAFVLDGVSPGTYSIGAEKDGYGAKAVDVTVTESGGDVEIKLAPNAGVTLRIVDARDGRQLSAYVRVMDMANKVVYESSFRSATGGADTMKLPLDAGTYRAIVLAQGYATQNTTLSAPSSQTIAMTPGGTIAIKSTGSSMRRARLLGADGRDYMRGFGYTSTFAVDPSPGTTTLENVAAGTYTLQILDGDAVTASTQVNVMDGQVVQVSI